MVFLYFYLLEIRFLLFGRQAEVSLKCGVVFLRFLIELLLALLQGPRDTLETATGPKEGAGVQNLYVCVCVCVSVRVATRWSSNYILTFGLPYDLKVLSIDYYRS